MPEIQRGLYEILITEALHGRLESLDSSLVIQQSELGGAEAGDRIALHLSRVIERVISGLDDEHRVATGISLARDLIARIDTELAKSEAVLDSPVAEGQVLRAALTRRPDGTPETIDAPLIPLLDTTLLTNSPGEPRVGSQLAAEINSADRIDVVMAFVRASGIRSLLDALRRRTDAGMSARVLTTTYTGSTERAALDLLQEAGAEIRVSYDISSTRLHAKAWLFHRASGFSTAYIGSSNLTHSAQVTGLEWNVRVSGARNPDVIAKVAAVFDSYWSSDDFVPYDGEQFDAQNSREDRSPVFMMSPTELRPEPFQDRLLEQIELSRQRGNHRNLLVAATGTGKTVMAAIDYARLSRRLGRSRLLFVAHRAEILEQALWTFRYALRDAAFGEQWVGGNRPRHFDHVFASIQSLSATGLAALEPDHFDVVIVDEFHHAAASTYKALLDHVEPVELLGLTATPERSDGLDVLRWFDGRIAAELRLWDAIDQHRLAPFLYYGVSDGLDLRDIPWKRGQGYDVEGLTNLYTADDAWARRVIAQLHRRVDDVGSVRALGFCVSVGHARFMARVFNAHGIRSVAVWADSPTDERRQALEDLVEGRVNVVFSVDLFNEGVDVPLVDTLLFLRPTDSPTLFLQQLGRGLRRAPDKDVCTVLDFVGQHRREFRFDRRFRALLGGTRKELETQIERGFPFLPAGCHMELDEVARDSVLANIRASVPSNWRQKVEELRLLVAGGREARLASYLDEVGLELDDLYSGGKTWSDLCGDAGVPTLGEGPAESTLRRAIGRLVHVDDPVRLDCWRTLVAGGAATDLSSFGEHDLRLARMLVSSMTRSVPGDAPTVGDRLGLLWAHPQVRAELMELFDVLSERVDHLHSPVSGAPQVPLQVHARYTRDEILAGFGVGATDSAKVLPWQSGAYWARHARADLFAFTLDKTQGGFSPTTRYRDYAISRSLVHWESQNVTRADSETGLRYQQHAEQGTSVMLFARVRSDDRSFWFLGPATYVSHEGERPMAITWRLEHDLPGDLFAEFAAAVA